MDPKTYLENILTGIIEYPADMKVERSQDEMGVLLSVSVAKPDMGRIIGKDGITSKAIRRLVDACGYRSREKVSVKILEPAI